MESENLTNVISQQCIGLECSMQTSQLQLLGAGSHEGWSPTRTRLESTSLAEGRQLSPKAQTASSVSKPLLT